MRGSSPRMTGERVANPLMPAKAGIQFFLFLALGPREFIPDLIGDGDERRSRLWYPREKNQPQGKTP